MHWNYSGLFPLPRLSSNRETSLKEACWGGGGGGAASSFAHVLRTQAGMLSGPVALEVSS